MRIDLVEGGVAADIELSADQATALQDCAWVSVSRAWTHGYAVAPTTWIGSVAVGDVEIHVAPKVPIGRVFFMLGYAAGEDHWLDSTASFDTTDDLVGAMAAAFLAQAQRATAQGLLQGYRTQDDDLPVVRGRINVGEQLTRRYSMPLPVAVTFDEFGIDIPENQILMAACRELLRVPGLDSGTRLRLGHLSRVLADVSAPARGAPLPRWTRNRLNARYHVALVLAEMIVAACSVEQGSGSTQSTGFMINMATLFESFVSVALTDALVAHAGGRVETQVRWTLDVDEAVNVRPDIVWFSGAEDTVGAIVDAKYKAEKARGGYPNADLYQMLAYCTVAGIREGHMIYAQGETEPGVRVVKNANVRLVQHALDLRDSVDGLQSQIGAMASRITRDRACTATPQAR